MPHSSICYLRLDTSAKACSHHDVRSKYVECVTNELIVSFGFFLSLRFMKRKYEQLLDIVRFNFETKCPTNPLKGLNQMKLKRILMW